MAKADDGAFWSIIAYLISGLVFWGGAGAIADHFFHTHIFFLIGALVGMSAGLWLIWLRFIRQ